MHRTQLYLDEGQYQALRSRARRAGKSLAALVREILDAAIGKRPRGRDALDGVIGIGKGDGEAVAENVDDYLYGEKR